MPALISDINKPISSLDNNIPRLALRIFDLRRGTSTVKPNEALRMPKHAPVIVLLPRQQLRRIVLVAAGEQGVLLRESLDGVLHAGDACSIAQLHAEVGREPVAGRAGGESSRAVELVSVLFHPLHYRVETGLAVPAALVDEDLLSWVGHVVNACGDVLRENLASHAICNRYLYPDVCSRGQETCKQEAKSSWPLVKVVLCSPSETRLLRSKAQHANQ